ncbi:MAG: hypothetical protein H0Z34_08530 [Brevibacillus sp.]|nr:hypothetical protein [Brevibacillus sp.]
MNAIRFYRQEHDGETVLSYDFYEHNFAPTNLVVRKLWMAMLDSSRHRLTHLRIEYNDHMLAEKLGRRAAEVLRLLGASRETIRENKNDEGITYSRTFTAPLSDERFQYLYYLQDISQFPHYCLMEEQQERVVFYFQQYLSLRLPAAEQRRFFGRMEAFQIPYQVVEGGR